MYRYLLVMVLLLHLNVYGQVDQRKLDSLSRAIDSSAKSHKSWQDSFIRSQDSIYHSAVAKKDLGKSRDLDNQDKAERRRLGLRMVIAVFIMALVIAFVRKRKRKI